MSTRALALLVAAVFLMASCSGGEDASSGTEDDSETTTAGTADTDSTDTTAADTETTAAGPTTTEAPEVVALGASSELYEDLDLWHCHPEKSDDVCGSIDRSSTVIGADGSATVDEFEEAVDPAVDCFYVYPTLNLDSEPGIQAFDAPLNPIETFVTATTFAPFGEACRLFAPRYEQMTIGGYQAENFEELFAVGDADVEEALDHYLATANEGRPFVLVGHSQGSHHLVRVLQKRFDGDDDASAAMRSQMLSALLIGPTGWVYTPEGEATGGTFERLELCTTEDQVGCVVAYDSYSVNTPPSEAASSRIPDGMQRACTNPADLGADDEPALLSGPQLSGLTSGLTTLAEDWPDFYSATCATDVNGQPYLEIAAAPAEGDARTDQLLPDNSSASLHQLDPNLGMGDMVDLVGTQAAAFANG